jgi:flagellar M-ring protein FliF
LLAAQGTDATTGLDPGKLAYVQEMEQSYIRRIRDILEPITGMNNVRTQVTADVDFNLNEQTAETYKPNGTPAEAATRSLQSSESNNNAGAMAPGGVPGAQSNQPSPTVAVGNASNGAATNSAMQKQNTVNYELDKTILITRQSIGSLKRLSAAVVINNRKVVDAKGQAKMVPLEKAELEQITALVKEAMGFNEKRGDTLNVINTAFSEPEQQTVAPVVAFWKQPDNISYAKEGGKNLLLILFALYLVFAVFRPLLRSLLAAPTMQPSQLVGDEGSVVTLTNNPSHANNLETVRQLARQEPKIVANVVKNWVNNGG